MINLRTRTEYSFGVCFGPIPRVIAAMGKEPALGIADRHGTWGHVAFYKAMKKAGKKMIFGVELAVVSKLERERHPANFMAFLARTNAGLREIYELTTEATAEGNFYYHPRIDYNRVNGLSQDVIVLSGVNPNLDLLKPTKNLFVELAPSSNEKRMKDFAARHKLPLVATSDNFYPRPEDRAVYDIVAWRNRDARTTAMHIMTEWEWLAQYPQDKVAVALTHRLTDECQVEMPKAKMVKFKSPETLEVMCRKAAPARKINLKDPVYEARLKRELDLIAAKDFEDYFFVIADLIKYAKLHMLVGPARGSSCGSLVCYLTGITDIDPIKHNLLFERFIDITRSDLPDIDIDFADDRREMVFEYARKKYGEECVARLGTISRFQARSALDIVAKNMNLPYAEMEDLKGAIIERSGGDSRAAFCILDTFDQLDIGKRMLEKYPQLRIAADLEYHAQHSGQHAAGIVITAEPINHFCSKNLQTGAVMIDKYDSEALDFLKIDALGLRTLSVIQDCLEQVKKPYSWLLDHTLEDEKAFDLLNRKRFAGVFQFEGYSLQSVCNQMHVDAFYDIALLTAIARPGPINSGTTTQYIFRRDGRAPVQYLHPLMEESTKETLGLIVYQEQMMIICRVIGHMQWDTISKLRKAVSKSLGKEYFDQYWMEFRKGALEQGIDEAYALTMWNTINSFGSWAFNKSHAIAYGMVSYYCLVLKAHYPLEWAVACLRNSRGEDQCVKLLRELVTEGYEYKDVDAEASEINWSIKQGRIVGGLLNIKGIGEKKAQEIVERRRMGLQLTPSIVKKLAEADTPYHPDKVFECRARFGDIIDHPEKYNLVSKIWKIGDIDPEMQGEFLFFGKLLTKNLRDLNEPYHVTKRGGTIKVGNTLYLICIVSDDTSNIFVTVREDQYQSLGKPIVEQGQLGDWYLFKGWQRRGFRRIYLKRYIKLTGVGEEMYKLLPKEKR